jgi:hypothetical protein
MQTAFARIDLRNLRRQRHRQALLDRLAVARPVERQRPERAQRQLAKFGIAQRHLPHAVRNAEGDVRREHQPLPVKAPVDVRARGGRMQFDEDAIDVEAVAADRRARKLLRQFGVDLFLAEINSKQLQFGCTER